MDASALTPIYCRFRRKQLNRSWWSPWQNAGRSWETAALLHDAGGKLVRPWAHRAWVACLLSLKGIVRPQPVSQRRYSALFFLDEVTAFAAGHRPCARCQRERHLEFKRAWLQANVPNDARSSMSVSQIDNVLHRERTTREGEKLTFDASLVELPLGAMFEHEGLAYLLDARGCLPWSFGGYHAPTPMEDTTMVKVLTPRSILRAFANGFAPGVHPSANGSLPSRESVVA